VAMKKFRSLVTGVVILFCIISLAYAVSYAEEPSGKKLSVATGKGVSAEVALQPKTTLFSNNLFQTALVVVIGYFLIFLLVGIVNRRVKDLKLKHLVRKNIVYIVNFFILLLIIFIWLHNINSITIFLSVIGAGLALALQEVILCVAGWFLILARRPFEVGDRIEMGGVKGDVIDIRLFQTSVLEIGNWVDADQSTGRIVNIPNSAVFKKENYNYNRGFEFIWNEIKILVTFESDWKRAEEIMLARGTEVATGMEDVVKRKIDAMTSKYMIHYEKFTPIVYVDIKDSGVGLTLRYLTEARTRRATHDTLCRAILNDFEKEARVHFAYPTYRIIK
jgi:small-conductance mechanosensitive channel